MYIVIIQQFKKDLILTNVRLFKKKCIGYWLCILVNKIKGRKIEVVKE